MAFSSLPLFDDDDDLYETSQPSVESDEEDRENEPPSKKHRERNRNYMHLKDFKDQKEFSEWIAEKPDDWRKGEFHSNKDEDVQFYRCTSGRRTKYECKVRLRVSYSALSPAVSVSVTGEHDHMAKGEVVLTEAVKQMTKELTDTGLLPYRIHQTLRQRGVNPLPALQQIQNLVNRNRKSAGAPFTDVQLRTYCEAGSAVPEDPDKPFIFSHGVDSAKEFFFAKSTPKLLAAQQKSGLLQLDSTYSLSWHNYPVHVLGYSNRDRQFVPTALAVTQAEDTSSFSAVLQGLKAVLDYVPEVVLADGAKAITAAVADVFPGAKRAMCWAHVLRNVDKWLKKIKDKDLRKTLREDVMLLQLARGEAEFHSVADLMLSSWPGAANEFAEYFERIWVKSSECNWYEGCTDYVCNNNGLEACNRIIKDGHTLRRMLPFADFLHASDDMGSPLQPTIPPSVYADAYKLSKSGCFWRRLNGQDRFIVPSSASGVKSAEDLANLYHRFGGPINIFFEYRQQRLGLYVVTKSANGAYYTCSCHDGSKKRACKHATMVMCSQTVALHSYPPDAAAQLLEPRRKKGRPTQKPNGQADRAAPQNRFALASANP